jgi:hypothetical protein
VASSRGARKCFALVLKSKGNVLLPSLVYTYRCSVVWRGFIAPDVAARAPHVPSGVPNCNLLSVGRVIHAFPVDCE